MSNQPNMRILRTGGRGAGSPPQPPRPIQVDLDRQESFHCPQCKDQVFIQGVAFREISALVSRSGKAELATLPVPICAKCGWAGTVQKMIRLSPEERAVLAAEAEKDGDGEAQV